MASLVLGFFALIAFPIYSSSFFNEGLLFYFLSIAVTIASLVYTAADRWNYDRKPTVPYQVWLVILTIFILETAIYAISSIIDKSDELYFLYIYLGLNVAGICINELAFNPDSSESSIIIIKLSDYTDEALKIILESNKDKTVLVKGIIAKTEQIYEEDSQYTVHLKSKNPESKINVICHFNHKLELAQNEKYSVSGKLCIEEDNYGRPVYKLI